MTYVFCTIRLWAHELAEKARMRCAWLLPRWLVYWCTIRLWAHATTGEHGNTEPMSLRLDEALRRWER